MVSASRRCLAQDIGLGGIIDMTNNVRTTPEKFISTLTDVVWRFHVYDQYGQKRDNAIKALTKRAPGYPFEYYEKMFDLNLKILIETIVAVENASKSHTPGQKFSDYSDVDAGYVLKKLRSSFPGQPDEFLTCHLGMVIYYYYLR
jgi:hypothetical protein